MTLTSAAPPTKLVMLDKSVGAPIKARDADVYVFTLSRFEEFPDLWVSSGAFTDMKKISDANPQQAQYNWGMSEVIEYVNADGKTLKAILTKPEDFDPSKKDIFGTIGSAGMWFGEGLDWVVGARAGFCYRF